MTHVTIFDLFGLAGVVLLLGAYALTVSGRLDARQATALTFNLLGPLLILLSLSRNFNLAAAAIEGAWALIAGVGLVRLASRRRR